MKTNQLRREGGVKRSEASRGNNVEKVQTTTVKLKVNHHAKGEKIPMKVSDRHSCIRHALALNLHHAPQKDPVSTRTTSNCSRRILVSG
jgi:hypothetical protein